MRRIALLAALAALLAPARADADHRETVLASPGGGAAFYSGGSADGKHVYFATSESLAPEDTDSDLDLYDRHDGRTDLVSVPEPGASGGGGGAAFSAATADGSRVYFITQEGLTADDNDGLQDVYLREGGHTKLVSQSQAPFNFLGLYFWCGSTDDGGHVWFRTTKALAADDTDFSFDLYEYDAGTGSLEMVSRTESSSNAGGDVGCAGHSSDGSQSFFSVSTPMTSDDTDGATDIYRRTSSGTELMTPDTAEDVHSMSTSDDGEHVIFESTERLVPADTDDQKDVYERTGGHYVLVSQGPGSFNDDFRSDFQRASADGTRIFWTTSDHPVAGDTDDTDDIFLRSGGSTQIVSHGPSGGDGGAAIVVERVNRAGTRLYFRTGEDLTPDDHDFSLDSYEWHDGTLRRVSVAGSNDQSIGYDAGLAGATEDGGRTFFTSLQSMDAADTDTPASTFPDGYDDIFEHVAGGGSAFVSTGPTAGTSPPVDAFFRGFSADGEKVWWDTTERLTAGDADTENDVYESRVNHSPRVTATVPGTRYDDGAAPVPVDAGIDVVDADTPELTGASVRVTHGFAAGDALAFTPEVDGIAAHVSGDELTLTGAATPAEYQAALRRVTFATDGSGALGDRAFAFSVTDGIDTSAPAGRTVEVVGALQVPHSTAAPTAAAPDAQTTRGDPMAALRLSAVLGSPLVLRADGLPVGCRLAGAFLRRCDVVVRADDGQAPSAGAAVLGRGTAVVATQGRHRAVVHAQLSRAGIAYVRRSGRRGERVHMGVTARSFDGRSATTTGAAWVLLPGRYVVPASGGYGPNQAGLSHRRRTQLAAIARQLTGVGEARCEGHADGGAERRHARLLAFRRAAAVCQFLHARGVSAKLVVRSFASSRPRAGDATRHGRRLNRRVEVVVVR